jgi:repressor LexA
MEPGLIRARIAERRLSKTALAQALGMSQATLSALLAGRRRVTVEDQPKLIEFLGLDRVPLVGVVEPGGEIVSLPAAHRAEVQLPFVPSAALAAVRLAGFHLWPRYGDGDVVIYWEAQRRPLVSYFGEEVLVATRNPDRRMLGLLSPLQGHARLMRLQQLGSPDYLDVEVTWLGEICCHFRARQLVPLGPGLFSACPGPLK